MGGRWLLAVLALLGATDGQESLARAGLLTARFSVEGRAHELVFRDSVYYSLFSNASASLKVRMCAGLHLFIPF